MHAVNLFLLCFYSTFLWHYFFCTFCVFSSVCCLFSCKCPCVLLSGVGELIGCVLLSKNPLQTCIGHFLFLLRSHASNTSAFTHVTSEIGPSLRLKALSGLIERKTSGYENTLRYCPECRSAVCVVLVEKLFNISVTTEFIHMALHPKSFVGEKL